LCVNLYKKLGWDTFWAIFSQTRPVTLVSDRLDGAIDFHSARVIIGNAGNQSENCVLTKQRN
jgi:hypothetical protein